MAYLPNAVQWGRSSATPWPYVQKSVQLVRVDLPQAMDVTIYMLGLRGDGHVHDCDYEIDVGAGGISIQQGLIRVPAQGLAVHYVASSITVTGRFDAASSWNFQNGETVRVAAAAVLGRPCEYIEPARNTLTKTTDALVWTAAGPNSAQFDVPPFATHVRFAVWGPLAASNVKVNQFLNYKNFAGAVLAGLINVPQLTAANFTDWVPLDPRVSTLQLQPSGAVPGDTGISCFFKRKT
jgi:hypothetical protein